MMSRTLDVMPLDSPAEMFRRLLEEAAGAGLHLTTASQIENALRRQPKSVDFSAEGNRLMWPAVNGTRSTKYDD